MGLKYVFLNKGAGWGMINHLCVCAHHTGRLLVQTMYNKGFLVKFLVPNLASIIIIRICLAVTFNVEKIRNEHSFTECCLICISFPNKNIMELLFMQK